MVSSAARHRHRRQGRPAGQSFAASLLIAILLSGGFAPLAMAQPPATKASPATASPAEASPRTESQPRTVATGDDRIALPTGQAAAGQTLTTIPSDLWGIIQAGGPVMIPLGLCSLIAVAFGMERMVILRRGRVIPRDFVVRFIDHLEQGQLDRQSALEVCEQNGSPVAAVFAQGVRKWGKPAVEVEQSIIDGGERQVSHLRKNLRVLNAVSTVSPLLGLFGTVVGMIMCFNQIASSSAMGKAEQLAGGIGVALITTAAGLAIAIPALILYMYLVGRVDALVMEMDELAQRVVNLISAEGLANPPVPKTARTKAAEAKEKEPREKEVRESKKVAASNS